MTDSQHGASGARGVDQTAGRDVRPYLEAYVERLKTTGALHGAAAERAFRSIPRHLFVERFFVPQEAEDGPPGQRFTAVEHDPQRPQPAHLETIYSDAALITRVEDGVGTSASSQPGLMAEMLRLLELRPGMRVLEIGAGTGYNAALLAALVGDPALVTTVDIQADVVEQTRRGLARAGYAGPGGVRLLCRDGAEGAPEGAPFDRIVATVGCPDASPRWAEQLAPRGFMLLPLRHAGTNPLVRVWRESGGTADESGGRDAAAGALVGRVVGFSGFMAIQGTLHDDRYYDFSPPPADAGEEERPLWPELSTGRATGEAQGRAAPVGARLAFLFYLGLRAPRARLFRWLSSFGLEDTVAGRTARLDGDRLVGEPALLDALEAYYRDWRGLGAPGMDRYAFRLVPRAAPRAESGADETGGPAAGPWTLPGTYYRRVITLPPAWAISNDIC